MKIINKKLVASSLVAMLFASLSRTKIAKADIVSHPDANTLWREDGLSTPTGSGPAMDHWNGELAIKAKNGALQLHATDPQNHMVGRYVKIDPAFPYLTWDIKSAQPAPGYVGFSLSLATSKQGFGFSLVSQINPGRYVLDTSPFFSSPTTAYLRFYLYHTLLTLDNLSLVKTSPNWIEITSPAFVNSGYASSDDDVTCTVYLEEKAEDVSLTFYDSYTMPQVKINGEQTLQLKPKNTDQKVWSATVKLQSIENLRSAKDGQLPAFHLMTKATILGGSLKEPLWTALEYPVHLAAAKKSEGSIGKSTFY